MKKCRPVVKEPSGGTLLFRCALPARGASRLHRTDEGSAHLCLGAACTGCIHHLRGGGGRGLWPLPRRCLHGVHHGWSPRCSQSLTLPRRCLHGVHLIFRDIAVDKLHLCLGAACTGCIHGAADHVGAAHLCLGAACTECISICIPIYPTSATLPRRCLHGVHRNTLFGSFIIQALPRRCLHGVHRQKPTNCGTPFCSIRRESVDSFSEINNKDSCADYFPALFCCQGDLHHHYRQPRTDNRPVLRCEQHRLFLFILSSHYRRLL